MTASGGNRSAIYLYRGDEVKPSVHVAEKSVELLKQHLQRAGTSTVLSGDHLMSASAVVINGIGYRMGTVLLAEFHDNIKLLQVDEILVHDHSKFFVCNVLRVNCFDSHRNAFCVEQSDDECIICLEIWCLVGRSTDLGIL